MIRSWPIADASILALLISATTIAFLPSLKCEFTLDDDVVIANQPHVSSGVKAGNVRWALTAFELGYPIPVTLCSFMLDAQLFGMRASLFHAENVAWHVADVVLLYLLLLRLTGCRWRGALVSILFAVHPLRVESVTWVTERKDVLAAFFGLLAMHAYVSHARRGGLLRNVAVLLLFALSLLAKPMLLLLPLLLLALDYWPLQRLGRVVSLRRALLEKVPMATVSLIVALIGILGPSPRNLPVSRLPWSALAANAVVSCVRYIGKLFWFRHLSIVYPIVPHWPALEVIAAAIALLAVTGLACLYARRRPWLLVGWLWYVVILLPASGLHVLGDFSMADRYTYFPTIGLLVMLCWSLPDRIATRAWRLPAGAAVAIVLAGLVTATRGQVMIWHDNISLFRHAVDTAGPSLTACGHLATGLARARRFDEAIPYYKQALAFDPVNIDLLTGLASASDATGDLTSAVAIYRTITNLKPEDDWSQYNLGTDLVALGRPDEAIAPLTRATELNPRSTQYRGNLAAAFLRAGHFQDAIDQSEIALRADASATGVRQTLASALARSGRLDAARQQFELVILNDPRSSAAFNGLGEVSLEGHRLQTAISCFEQALAINPKLVSAHNNLGVAPAQAGNTSAAEAEFRKALEVEPGNSDAMRNLRLLVTPR